VAFYAGTLEPLGAAVTFYGGGVTQGRFGLPPLTELARSLQTPWLGLFGDRDAGIPVEQVEELRTATDAVAVETEIVRYPEAQHGFHCNDRPAVFDPDAAKDGWERTLDWMDAHIGS
jgi:carboxymethylenebutenolidase